MAAALLRRRVSALGVSPFVKDNVESFWLWLELKGGCGTGVFKTKRHYGSCGSSRKFDFTDLKGGSSNNSNKLDLTDLTRPHTWYPVARKKRRKVILHVGPTNSGKTHSALKQLELSLSGVYCGPLRLLAWEVATRMNKAKVPCDLITGQEREEVEGAKHKSMTVEMADVTANYQCAVIDEIQMVGCKTRGYAFTRALLGLAADELHLCGDSAAVALVEDIVKVTGDDLEKQIERGGERRCAVVYGSLPPQTRTRQATMFNDANSEFDVLVASDAIGMGLNLQISRLIFSSMTKFDGVEFRELTVPEIKQIAGRAGRYGSKYPVGEVTCVDEEDLPLLHTALNAPSPTLERAGLFPTFDLLLLYSHLNPQFGFRQILEHFLENAKLSENYFIADCEDMLKVAAIVDELPLALHDKYLFCLSPVDVNDDISTQGLIQFAQNYAKRGMVHLREIFTPGTLQVPKTHTAMKELESIHKVLELYVWLSFRMEDSFPDSELAASQKAICGLLIEEFLEKYGLQMPRGKRLPLHKSSSSILQ
ncbi:hypothetical protein ACJRO7_010229 [Eucalyptus globulus]|uniref:RNA helicase n=1 Tax=Eucalyptus globulus TaxID=34317 RepID=A0ABD3LC77_EUCGL